MLGVIIPVVVARARRRIPRALASSEVRLAGQTVNEEPQPQPPLALGFLKANPDPIMLLT